MLSRKNKVNINAWVRPKNEENSNVGDLLSVIVTKYMCDYNGIDIDCDIKGTKHLYAIGSILLGYKDAVIWGSGFGRTINNKLINKLYGVQHRLLHKIDIRAVRGPETKKILESMGYKCPDIYGDPAILMPLFYSAKKEKKKKYVVVYHYSQKENCKDYNEIEVLDTFCSDWKKFIDVICSAELVISSSLHGIILAEAYGVPAIMLSKGKNDDITKYKDWYYSTGRKKFPIAENIEEAIKLTPSKVDNNKIRKMQKDLLNSFPVDLWR